MTVRHLDALFQPKSVAVVGASPRAGSIGAMVWARVLDGAFDGAVWPVNPKYDALNGYKVVPDVDRLPAPPSVAVICTPPATWPGIVHKLGVLGARVAVIVGEARTSAHRAALDRALKAAKPFVLRIVGPGSLGVLSPARHAHFGAPAYTVRSGGVAWVSQSNALTNAVLGWADARGLGFSHVVALGGEADVDAGDVLDYLASDPGTRAILLELDSVRAARKFMSAARAAARNKPVLALRTGRADPGDALYTAAFQRAGMVRVDALDDLLDEIETLGVGRVAARGAATLVTSDAGVAKLAVDAVAEVRDVLAEWPAEATAAVAQALPHLGAPGNPLTLGDDARPEHFGAVIRALAPFPQTGTLFVVHSTSHSAPADAVARMLIETRQHAHRGILACFFGAVDASTRDALHANGIPVHTTPQRLARAYARLVDYNLGRELLMQTPEGTPPQPAACIASAREEARGWLEAGRHELAGEPALQWLAHFGLQGAAPSDEPRDAVVVDVMVDMHDDPNFGPVFRYLVPPADGVSAPFVVYGLPPLNTVLARAVMERSPYARRAPVEPALGAFTALSQVVCDVREVVALSLTLRVLPDRVRVIAPRITLAEGRSRLAIMPYPRHLEQTLAWQGDTMTIRPIRPEDEAAHNELLGAMTPEDLRMRFFGAVRSFDHSQLARMTQIDYDREMAFIASVDDGAGRSHTLGAVRAVTDPDNETTEFAIGIRPDQKGKGLGRLLMARIIEYARSRGTAWMIGEALRENTAMIALARACGFTVTATEEPGIVGFRMKLQA
ncbi:GCN5 family acetyltransferase [Burkholderia ubonensis]|uniref:bifunctional acetate--CoA ligase family protein/GNAT family N-acetyltransferase n=1 Tax=Burkholderia ubonensis TaxID=101571 RepID=UPI00075963D3|nr:GNAT family N-acetyltransferase [Burkholderia ubonensis]KVD59396.1 GCN5 family acetyltransferase [Burkholderia ubonensis]KVD61901.1 GCN5 family acetyltransferase [Burkholderia ubonensis]KVU68776.1 GCN5 family acetyltransferase [Burkholderia ubonensis]KWC46057.1 GCN5 family acetyltransferase [Burkholderia ubonensis]KWH10874.1 GCN5 family acetyltransferase [Burkholderia ubonensis]